MGDNQSRAVFIYFGFLVLVLLGITLLAVHILIDTSLRINKVRNDIEATPDKEVMEEKLNNLSKIYLHTINDIINTTSILRSQAEALDKDILLTSKELQTMFSELKKDYDTKFKDPGLQVERRFNERLSTIKETCENAIKSFSSLLHDWNSLERRANLFNGSAKINEWYHDIHKLLLPQGYNILTDGKTFKETAPKYRTIRRLPHDNEFLALDDGLPGQKYQPSPTAQEINNIELFWSDGEASGIGYARPGTNETNVTVSFQFALQRSGLVLDHSYDIPTTKVYPYQFQNNY